MQAMPVRTTLLPTGQAETPSTAAAAIRHESIIKPGESITKPGESMHEPGERESEATSTTASAAARGREERRRRSATFVPPTWAAPAVRGYN
eukprot:CAMPEP_0179916802 /NCGR_PEP_ID=MMETSP0983-20121128/2455_1 /TAXON_ID=483367 /ORGANISM="non described non described, Strain CCMP 2436" /LENGTH=91 /DNA_ID=CAMNT_0021819417 /DNA_START=642 /DNA_END=917 /DNA_ORIENTATION=-